MSVSARGLSRLSTAPALTLELEDGATVDGVVHVTFRAPAERLKARGLPRYAVEQHGQS